LAEAFLQPFNVIDGPRILEEDWTEARRIAKCVQKRNPAASRKLRREPNTGPRDLADSLITAIARRQNYDVFTRTKACLDNLDARAGKRFDGLMLLIDGKNR
jgi:hypothetical protein